MDAERLTFDFLKQQPNICGDCEDDDGTFPQYEIRDAREAWYRVLIRNEVDDPPQGSLLGPEGHIERCSVATHLLAAALMFLYVAVRPALPFFGAESTSNDLAVWSYVLLALCYFVSAVYHVYSPVRLWSAVTRLFDYAFIYVALASGLVADLSLVTNHLRDVPWQAYGDTCISAAILTGFFVFRRTQLPIEQTRVSYFRNKCALGFARHTNVDLEHSSLRAAGGLCLMFAWVLNVASAFKTLPPDCAAVFVATRIGAAVVLVAGMYFDNNVLFPESFLEKNNENQGCMRCFHDSKAGCGHGWVLNSHALWHLVAFVSATVGVAGREYVVSRV